MLINLKITNFAIIKNLEITLRPGLNILSGETGAGKSIIINGVNLILGGRASADLIRTGCEGARVEALFSFPQNRVLKELLSELDIPYEGELLIKRIISREGRNRISVNGSMATLQMLTRLSSLLISISGQYEHQRLLKPENHLFLLDDFAGLVPERETLTLAFNDVVLLKDRIRRLEKDIQGIAEKQELTRFQIQEIEAVEITPHEDDALMAEKKRLQHAEDLLVMITNGYETLYEKNDSVLSAISKCLKQLNQGADMDTRIAPVRDQLQDLEAGIEDIAYSLRDLEKTIHMDPQRLEEVMERLELLNRLKRKYGPALDDVLNTLVKLKNTMFDMREKDQLLEQLHNDRLVRETKLIKKASDLSEKRKQTAKALEKAVEKELQFLHMKETRFQVGFNNLETEEGSLKDMRAEGFDNIEFLISPNVGEDLRPLSKIASGGELSRIMLAIKTILARKTSVETVVFDEVDSGVSGATAEAVGKKVLSLARFHQILCITHLPQIASKGLHHFLVKKQVDKGRTHTTISALDTKARELEIARLLGGEKISEHALANAREMLNPQAQT